MEAILIGLLYLFLRIAIILFVAYALLWMAKVAGISIDANVYKFGKIIVGLLILIAVVLYLFSIRGVVSF